MLLKIILRHTTASSCLLSSIYSKMQILKSCDCFEEKPLSIILHLHAYLCIYLLFLIHGRCVTLIGLAVGSNIFREDAHHIMKLLLANGINFQYVSDDPQISYLISAWARICKILGPEFAQYLESVMPTVIAAAEFEPDVAIINGKTLF